MAMLIAKPKERVLARNLGYGFLGKRRSVLVISSDTTRLTGATIKGAVKIMAELFGKSAATSTELIKPSKIVKLKTLRFLNPLIKKTRLTKSSRLSGPYCFKPKVILIEFLRLSLRVARLGFSIRKSDLMWLGSRAITVTKIPTEISIGLIAISFWMVLSSFKFW